MRKRKRNRDDGEIVPSFWRLKGISILFAQRRVLVSYDKAVGSLAFAINVVESGTPLGYPSKCSELKMGVA